MKASNKILIGIFGAPLVIVTSLNIALYAKYKTGNYIAMTKVHEDRYLHIPMKKISSVAVYGLNNFNIIPADSFKLEIEKGNESHLRYAINGDSLIIHGDSIVPHPGASDEIHRSDQSVNLYLPASIAISADNSEINLNGVKDSLKAKSYHIILARSSSLKVAQNGDDSNHVYFNALTIQAQATSIEFTAYTHMHELQLTTIASSFTDNGASIDKLMINADNVSGISLKGDNLKKLNMVH
ncbi:MAG: hypothetical protein ABJB86_01115 [Bacteroidota bacterium]